MGRSPSRRASSTRERTPSFPYARERCPSTVRAERKSAAATSLLERPSATSATTRCSTGRQPAGTRCPPTDACELGLRPLAPETGADCLERRTGALERLPGGTALLCSPSGRAEREQRARFLEWPRATPVQVQRLLQRGNCPRQVAGPGREEAAAAACHRLGGQAVQPVRVPLVPVEECTGLVGAIEPDQRFDRVADAPRRARLAHALPAHEPYERLQHLGRRERVAARELELAERRGREEPCRHTTRTFGEREGLRRRGASASLVAGVGPRPGSDAEKVRNQGLLPRLARVLELAFGQLDRLVEPSANTLDLTEHHPEVGNPALVADHESSLGQGVEAGCRTVEIVVPELDHGHREARLAHDPLLLVLTLQCERLRGVRARRRPPENRLADCPRGERRAEQITSSDRPGEHSRLRCMLDALGELVAKPERRCGDTLVRPQSCLVARCLLDGGEMKTGQR